MKQKNRGVCSCAGFAAFIFIMFFAASVTFLSCSRQKEVVIYKPIKEMQNYIFDSLMNKTAPEYFENLMMHVQLMPGGRSLYLFEKAYPACSGIYDSKDFYSGECDNGNWVDDVLFAMEESRLGDEVLSLLEDESLFQPPVIQELEEESDTQEKTDKETPEETVEKRLLDAYNRLKVMEYGKERFIPVQNGNESVFIHYADRKAVRYFYDEQFRLVKKEYWFMASVNDSKLTSSEIYEYKENSIFPDKKIIQNESSKVVSNFNQDGLVIRAEKISIINNGNEEQKPVERTTSLTTYEYDQEKRLVTEKTTDYEYEESKLKKKSEKKQVFIYKKQNEENDIPPDYEYYEDNVLRTSTEYTEKDKYSTLIIFDAQNSVRTYYENHIKIKDVYMTGGQEKRVRVYE